MKNIGIVRPNSEAGGKRTEETVMQAGDWIYAMVNVVVGVFLGVVIEGLVRLMTTAFWPVAVLILLPSAALFFFESLFDGLVDRVFSRGIRPARKPQTGNRTPLRLSLPTGVVLGVVFARLGLGNRLLGWIS